MTRYTDVDRWAEFIVSALLVAILIVLVVAANIMSYEDEVIKHEYYCEMVKAGEWPNYKNLNCEGEE